VTSSKYSRLNGLIDEMIRVDVEDRISMEELILRLKRTTGVCEKERVCENTDLIRT
jgi:hypothetical protein